MANKNPERIPLSFWATVGANITGGAIVGIVSATFTFIAGVFIARSLSDNVLEGLRQDGVLPPKAGEEPGA